MKGGGNHSEADAMAWARMEAVEIEINAMRRVNGGQRMARNILQCQPHHMGHQEWRVIGIEGVLSFKSLLTFFPSYFTDSSLQTPQEA